MVAAKSINNNDDDDYDLFAVDRAFIMSLFHGFCTVVPEDARQQITSGEADALQFVMVLRPRLSTFSHRRVFSLRHPAVSMAARQYFNSLRAANREEMRQRGDYSNHNNTGIGRASFVASTPSVAESVERSTQRTTSLPPIGSKIKTITLEQLNRNNWNLVETCHEIMLRSSKVRHVAVKAIKSNEMINDVICRYWERLTVPPYEPDVDGSFSFDGENIENGGSPTHGSLAAYATHMTAPQYVYLHLRIASILLPPDALQAEILDSIILDIRTDAASGRGPSGLHFGKAPHRYGYRGMENSQMDHEDSQSSSRRPLSPAAVAGTSATTSAAGGIGEGGSEGGGGGGEAPGSPKIKKDVSPLNGFEKSIASLPEINFGQFWSSMLELADNWTSSTHPVEHAAFLMELYCEVFAHEWDDEDAALLKTLRATISERSGRRNEGLLSLVDDELDSVQMLSEFNQMIWSIADYAETGSSYQPSINTLKKKSKLDTRGSEIISTPDNSFQEKRKKSHRDRGSREQGDGENGLIVSSWSVTDSTKSNLTDSDEESDYSESAGGRRRKRRKHGHRRYGSDDDSLDSSWRDKGKPLGGGGGGKRKRGKSEGGGKRRHDRNQKGELSDSDQELQGGRRSKGKSRRHKGSHGKYIKHGSGELRDTSNMSLLSYSHDSEDSRGSSYSLDSTGSRGAHGGHRGSREARRSRNSQIELKKRKYRYIRSSSSEEAFHMGLDEEGDESHHMRGRRSGSKSRRSSERRRTGDDLDSLSSYSSEVYSVPDSDLTPLSRERREQERQQRREEWERRRRERHERRRRKTGSRGEGKSARKTEYTPEEMAEKRAKVIQKLQAKGITIDSNLLSDEDILNLEYDIIDEELLRRLMQGPHYALDDPKESDFLHILLGDQESQAGVGAGAAGSVLAALRGLAGAHRPPPETAYARHLREQREREEAARRRREKEERVEQQRQRRHTRRPESATQHRRETLESPEDIFELTAPSSQGTQREEARRLREQQRQRQGQKEDESDDVDSLDGLWEPPQRRETRVPTPPIGKRNLPWHYPSFEVLPVMPMFTSRFTPQSGGNMMDMGEEIYEEAPHIRLHSPRRLAMFYRDINPDHPIKGRAPLAPQTSIIGGTYHQLPIIRRSQRMSQYQKEEEVTPPRRWAPVKLFSLTTKKTLSAAIRESLQRYVDDKTYLETLYGSNSK